jgi:hypothetical protein
VFWRKRSALAPPNVAADWIELEEWRTWDAPSNHIAGEASYVPALAKLVGPACSSGYCVFTPVRLVRERRNKYDSNAFRAEVRGELVGYLRKEFAAQLAAPLTARGAKALRSAA